MKKILAHCKKNNIYFEVNCSFRKDNYKLSEEKNSLAAKSFTRALNVDKELYLLYFGDVKEAVNDLLTYVAHTQDKKDDGLSVYFKILKKAREIFGEELV